MLLGTKSYQLHVGTWVSTYKIVIPLLALVPDASHRHEVFEYQVEWINNYQHDITHGCGCLWHTEGISALNKYKSSK